jgi:hypothetical protein
MQLNELKKKNTNKVMESRFGFAVNFDRMTVQKAEGLLETIESGLTKIRNSSAFHSAEKNPRYMELLMVKESVTEWLDGKVEVVVEGEVQTAEALLAAKDITDRLQGMVEDLGEMLNEDLPPLGDSINDQMGEGKGTQYVASASATLQGLLDAMKASKQALDDASKVITGEGPAPAMAGDEIPGEEQAMAGDEIPAEEPEMEPEEDEPVGREMR